MKNRNSRDFHRLWSYSVGFLAVWVAHIGRRVRLFETIASESVDRRGLADKLHLFYPAVDSWCSAAIGLGFIEEKRKLVISPRMREMLLNSQSPENVGGMYSYLALKSTRYGDMDQLFYKGSTISLDKSYEAIDSATDWDHGAFLRSLTNTDLHGLLKKGCSFLDVGCGTAKLIANLSERYPKSKFVGLEPSGEAVRIARENVASANIEIICMAGEDMQFDSVFDLIHFGEALYASPNKKSLLANCYKALKPSGRIEIIEGILPEKEVRRPASDAVILGMQLDFALHGHRFMKMKEVRHLLRDAGFGQLKSTHFGGRLFLIEAMKQSLGAKEPDQVKAFG